MHFTETFCSAFQHALFESRILDLWGSAAVLKHWPIRRRYGAAELWHTYLVYRVRRGSYTGESGRYHGIGRLCEEVCARTGADYAEVVDSLCWACLEGGTSKPFDSCCTCWGPKAPVSPFHLLCAAAYLGHLGLARQLLSGGYDGEGCPRPNNDKDALFPSPMRLAAFSGHAKLLMLFQDHLGLRRIKDEDVEEESEDYGDDITVLAVGYAARFKNTGYDAVVGAAFRGDLDMLRLAIAPYYCPEKREYKTLRKEIRIAAINTTGSLKVLQYIESRFIPTKEERAASFATYCEYGNVELARYLLDQGITFDDCRRMLFGPLDRAVKHLHDGVVDLLLQRGALGMSGKTSGVYSRTPLVSAGTGGSMRILRMLLAAGAFTEDLDVQEQRAVLGEALFKENTQMVEFLHDQGFLMGKNCDTRRERAFLRESLGPPLVGESVLTLLKKWD
ncbi:hypothetical protein F5Y08DRAFT_46054 [Xylaria arbuscula]|nr:hypothetical protein F5Y08DRAFT_46054 [Xylaria arbuscula]